jgi:MoxR-like ATPase
MSDAVDLTEEINGATQKLNKLRTQIGLVMVGQTSLIDGLLLALIADGHVLVEGLPGLAKTTAIKSLATGVAASFSRVQFTPDLLPADLIGTQIYRPNTGEFVTRRGPIFTQFLLADEINRAPAKVQSALLEAMGERQVTLANETITLDDPFLVMATQNPIEQEGTYPLPEAQIDRFMFKLNVGYPSESEELEIMRRSANGASAKVQPALSISDVRELRSLVQRVYVDAKVEEYIVSLVFATRSPASIGLTELSRLISNGASPRASIFLHRAAKAMALLKGRGFVTPADVKAVAPEVLRHRIGLTYEAEAQEVTSDEIVARILATVDVP